MKTLAVACIFVLAVLLLFSGVIFGPRTFLDANTYHYDPWRSYAQAGDTDNKTYRTDALFAYFPRRVELTESIRAGRIPLWNPYILGGMPFFADPQSRVAYPVSLLLVLADPVDAMAYDAMIHLAIAMLGMYLFLRVIGTNLWGSLLGGLAFGFSSFFYVRLGHATFISAAAWVPFFFYGFERARRSGPVWTVVLAVFLALGYLAGFPQVFFFGVVALVVYGLYTGIDTARGERRKEFSRSVRVLLVAGMLSFLLVAVQLIPFVELMRNSTGLGVETGEAPIAYLAPPILLLRAFFPSLFGNPIEGTDWSGLTRSFTHTYNPEFAVYGGVAALVAAAVALTLLRTDPRVRVFAGLLAVTVGLATSHALLHLAYGIVPLLDVSKISRIAVISCLALSALAGIGLSNVMGRAGPGGRKNTVVALGVVAALVVGVGLYVMLDGDSFVAGYLTKARELPAEFWERTHQEMRSIEIRDWARGDGEKWVAYEHRQVKRTLVFLVPAAVLLVSLAGTGKVRGPWRTGLAVAFVALGALDAGLLMKTHFISQVSSRPFETEGIRILERNVGDKGAWRIRSARYEHEDIKAFPPNTNMLFGIHSLNGTSTIRPRGYKQLYDAFGGTRALSKRWDRQPVVGVFEALASDFGCVRYAVANNRGLPAVFPPLIRLVAARAGIPSRARIVQVGDEARLAIWQRPGETLNFAVDLPDVRALKFAVGFESASPRPGDSVSVWLAWNVNGKKVVERRSFDLARDGGRWHPFTLDVARAGGGRVRIQMGCRLSGPALQSPPTIAWSGLDLVTGTCSVKQGDGAYEVSVGEDAEYAALEIASPAREIPLEVLMEGVPRKVRWVGFPATMPARKIFLDIRQRLDGKFVLRSDSAFALRACDVVYMDVGSSDYDLIYDKDMYIYENQTAIRKGICLDRDAVRGLGEAGDTLRLSALEDVGGLQCGTCNIVTYRPEDVLLDVKAASDCFLLFQDVAYPGWKAYVDGARAGFVPTDIGMRAIEVPAGEHRVEMKYRPGSLTLGLVLTALGVLLSVGYAWRWRKRD